MKRFPTRYVLEVQRAGHTDDEALVQATVALADQVGAPIVATHPIQFLSARDFRAHEARVCIAEGYTLSDARRPRRFSQEQYFLTQAQMTEKFSDLPQALSNSVAIAQRCNLTIPLGKNHLPRFPTPAACRSTTTFAARPHAASSSGSPSFIRTPRRASASAPNTSRASNSRRT
jgi:DNA polymerase-3 subunit alpha